MGVLTKYDTNKLEDANIRNDTFLQRFFLTWVYAIVVKGRRGLIKQDELRMPADQVSMRGVAGPAGIRATGGKIIPRRSHRSFGLTSFNPPPAETPAPLHPHHRRPKKLQRALTQPGPRSSSCATKSRATSRSSRQARRSSSPRCCARCARPLATRSSSRACGRSRGASSYCWAPSTSCARWCSLLRPSRARRTCTTSESGAGLHDARTAYRPAAR
jgi:hypothetical protein